MKPMTKDEMIEQLSAENAFLLGKIEKYTLTMLEAMPVIDALQDTANAISHLPHDWDERVARNELQSDASLCARELTTCLQLRVQEALAARGVPASSDYRRAIEDAGVLLREPPSGAGPKPL